MHLQRKPIKTIKHGVSLFIFLGVLSLVTTGFDFAVATSLKSNNNVEIASRIINQSRQENIAFNKNKSRDVLGVSSDIQLLSTNKCKEEINLKNKNVSSIVNFMSQMGLNPSFDSRAKLAASFKINNYTGTAQQNKKLIDLLILETSCAEQDI